MIIPYNFFYMNYPLLINWLTLWLKQNIDSNNALVKITFFFYKLKHLILNLFRCFVHTWKGHSTRNCKVSRNKWKKMQAFYNPTCELCGSITKCRSMRPPSPKIKIAFYYPIDQKISNDQWRTMGMSKIPSINFTIMGIRLGVPSSFPNLSLIYHLSL